MKLTVKAFASYRVGPSFRLAADADLTARTGQVTILSGDSGSGKSILLQTLAGFRNRTSPEGTIEADVFPSAEAPPIPLTTFLAEPTRLSYLPQESVLRPDLRPGRAVDDWCALLTTAYGPEAPVHRSVMTARDELIERLFSEEERRQLFAPGARVRIRNLSGGQRRRLDVMMALCSPAELIFLDEPDSGLDANRRDLLLETLVTFAATHRKIVILVSHYAGQAFSSKSVTEWTATRRPDGLGSTFSMRHAGDAPAPDLRIHEPPRERGNQRLDHFVVYTKQRLATLRPGRTGMLIAAPALLMAFVRLAIYPVDATDEPAMALLFFYAITCFWLGAIQSTGFWSDEQMLFNRECRQGTSAVAFLLSFLLVVFLITASQAVAGGCVGKYLSWADVLSGSFGAIGRDIRLGTGSIVFWGVVAGWNGVLAGSVACSIQHLVRPAWTGPTTAQVLALVLTLSAIVFSFPIIGSRAYNAFSDGTFSPNRLRLWTVAVRHLGDSEYPMAAIVVAEAPVLAAPAFHGLWFQGERPLRQGLPAARAEDNRKEAVPEVLANTAWCIALGAAFLWIGGRLKRNPVAS